jgi:hypothetical protein
MEELLWTLAHLPPVLLLPLPLLALLLLLPLVLALSLELSSPRLAVPLGLAVPAARPSLRAS